MNDGPTDDPFERRLRFGCGAILGVVLGSYYALRYLSGSGWSSVLAVIALAALFFGLLARRYGDSFWHLFSKWFHWWP
jgi:uncharacterized membrane protein YccC